MNQKVNSLLIEAGANSKYVNESKITFEELGMMYIEKLFFFNLIEEKYGVSIDKQVEDSIKSPHEIVRIIGIN